VGDPFKDTAGPSLHVLIKMLSTITLVMAPIFLWELLISLLRPLKSILLLIWFWYFWEY